MKTSSIQIALLVLVAAAAVVTALGQTTTNKKGGQGSDKKQIVGVGSSDLREPHSYHELRGNAETTRTATSTEIKTPTIIHQREKRGIIPGGYGPGGCPPCPLCPGVGIGSARRS